jgi:hypothetical protein
VRLISELAAQPDIIAEDCACPPGRSWPRSAVSYVSDVAPTRVHITPDNSAQVFKNQDINIHEQLDLGRHWGPLHKHATTPVPKEPGLDEVHGLPFRFRKNETLTISVVLRCYAPQWSITTRLAGPTLPPFPRSSSGTQT